MGQSSLQEEDELEIVATKRIVDFVDLYCQYKGHCGCTVERNEFIKGNGKTGPKTISFDNLRKMAKERQHILSFCSPCTISECNTNLSIDSMYLHELIIGSEIYKAPLKEPERNPELVKRLERLKKEQEQKEYNKMVENVASSYKKSTLGKEMGEAVRTTSQEVSSIVNFVLSVVGCFVFAFYAGQYAFGNVGLQVIFSIFVAAVVALAELYFMARTEI